MNRIGITAATVFGVLFFLATCSVVLAEDNESQDTRAQGSVSAQLQVQAGTETEHESESDEATSSSRREDNDKDDEVRADGDIRATTSLDDDANDDLDDDKGGRGEEHRSIVADVVLSLKALADRDSGIGEEVRKVAQEQASSSEHAAEAMAKVEARSALLSFLFGADFKNLGTLRSELATTQNHIDQLTRAKAKAISADVKAGIDAQISALQKANADANAFVEAHADTFSIFGWFTRLFNR